MKKIFVIIALFSCLYFSSVLYSQFMYDIYTPKGKPVTTFNELQEYSDGKRKDADIEYSSDYPEAQMIILYPAKYSNESYSSTAMFNCHGYAWLRVERGIDRWIDRPEEYKYWQDGTIVNGTYQNDGSYIQVPNETYPGKVSWIDNVVNKVNIGNHSAITTSVPGVVISKWGGGPFMKHKIDYSPYGGKNVMPNVKYYIKNCGGSETLQNTLPSANILKNFITFQNATMNNGVTVRATACNDIIVNSLTVNSGAALELDADGSIKINSSASGFKIMPGASLKIWQKKLY